MLSSLLRLSTKNIVVVNCDCVVVDVVAVAVVDADTVLYSGSIGRGEFGILSCGGCLDACVYIDDLGDGGYGDGLNVFLFGGDFGDVNGLIDSSFNVFGPVVF